MHSRYVYDVDKLHLLYLRLRTTLANQLIKAARTQHQSLFELSLKVLSIPERLQPDAFDTFLFHVRNFRAAERNRAKGRSYAEEKRAFSFTRWGMVGIGNLSNVNGYFSRNAANTQQLTRSWPDIINTSRAIFRGQKFYGDESIFLKFVSRFFPGAADASESFIEDDNVFDFAIELWKGQEVEGANERFLVDPLCTCLENATHGRIKHLLRSLGSDEGALSRLKNADVTSVLSLALFLCRLFCLASEKPSFFSSILQIDTTPTVLGAMKRLLDDTIQTIYHVPAIKTVINLVCTIATAGPRFTVKLVESVLLPLLLRAASHPDLASLNFQCQIMEEIRRSLIFYDAIFTTTREMYSLAEDGINVAQRLENSSEGFKELWMSFESLLLEQISVLHLFDRGFARELGVCANVSKLSMAQGLPLTRKVFMITLACL